MKRSKINEKEAGDGPIFKQRQREREDAKVFEKRSKTVSNLHLSPFRKRDARECSKWFQKCFKKDFAMFKIDLGKSAHYVFENEP